MRRFPNKPDQTAQRLIKAARQMGFGYQPSDGTVDGLLWLPGRQTVTVVDWKASEKAKRTEAQERLILAGLPIAFVWSEDQLIKLLGVG